MSEMKPQSNRLYDVLVVGGGPGGTAAAFRARELGLEALVIDADDLMKRIRDYSKDKLILPSFGGGDKMCFPAGGEMIETLRFAAIDKDEMCRTWKDLYERFRVPHMVGVELTGLDRRKDGIFSAKTWDHTERTEGKWYARHVVLALGCGVPRRLDVSGKLDSIAYRLDDPRHYLGRPICVIGGGTSAAEAVIALSNAKRRDDDPCAVFWSYRGKRLPRVSKALADAFFEAYLGNGNITYLPLSEPLAVVTGDDQREYLAIRHDRKEIAGRPREAALIEVPVEDCIACIGQDIPENFLASLGIPMVIGGKRNRKRMAVSPCLETKQPGVFIVGDLLSPAYLQTETFEGDPAGFEEVKHRGNIKAALRDGVLVAQVIAQKNAGTTEIDTRVQDGPPDSPEQKTEPVAQIAPVTREPYLTRVLAGGVMENEYALEGGTTTIGREGTDLAFAEDQAMAPHHASVLKKTDGYYLADHDSPGGVFVRLPPSSFVPIEPGSLIRIGRQFLHFVGSDGQYSFTHYRGDGRKGKSHRVASKPMIIGRDADVVLDPNDHALSRRHLAAVVRDGKLQLEDIGANGSFRRINGQEKLALGDIFQVGQQLFFFTDGTGTAPEPRHNPETPAEQPIEPVAVDEQPKGDGPSVTFAGTGKTVPVRPGQTLCEVAESCGIALTADCHAGICGSDPIKIVSGAENLVAPPGEQESDTLEDLCELEPGPHRLACMTQIKGPVTVEIIV